MAAYTNGGNMYVSFFQNTGCADHC